MKLSISNIAWEEEHDLFMYENMRRLGYLGLEIAPTRIFPVNPYDKLVEAKQWSEYLRETYGLSICSLQSIWYGRKERIFGSKQERKILMEYTKRAIEFSKIIGAGNLVFGCPRNRIISSENDRKIAVEFFSELANYAFLCGTILALEPNPVIYNTNFINNTSEALQLIKEVKHKGFMLNLDGGTILFNNEELETIKMGFQYVNHIHISEPNLKPIKSHSLWTEIKSILDTNDYDKYISIEMGKGLVPEAILGVMSYVKEWIYD